MTNGAPSGDDRPMRPMVDLTIFYKREQRMHCDVKTNGSCLDGPQVGGSRR